MCAVGRNSLANARETKRANTIAMKTKKELPQLDAAVLSAEPNQEGNLTMRVLRAKTILESRDANYFAPVIVLLLAKEKRVRKGKARPRTLYLTRHGILVRGGKAGVNWNNPDLTIEE